MTKIYVKSDDLRTGAGHYDQAVVALDHAVATYPALLADLPPDLRARAEHVEKRTRADVGEQRTFAAAEGQDLKTRALLADLLELGVLSAVYGKLAKVMPGMGRGPGIAKHFGKHPPHAPGKAGSKKTGQGGGAGGKAGKQVGKGALIVEGGGVDRRGTPPADGGDRTPHDPPSRPGESTWKAAPPLLALPPLFAQPLRGQGPEPYSRVQPPAHQPEPKAKREPKPKAAPEPKHKPHPHPHHRQPAEPDTFGDEFTP